MQQKSAFVASLLVLVTAVALETASRAAPNPPIPPGLLGGTPTSLDPQPKAGAGASSSSTASGGGLSWTPGAAPAEWTVLVYTVADNDLEGALLDDLDEMECVGSTPQVNIVMEIDRWRPEPGSPEMDRDDTTNGDWDDARRFYVTKDDCTSTKIVSKQLEDIGEIDMSHPKELAKFIAWGAQKFPAKHYALVMGDHGNGWKGAYVDENAPPEPQPMLMQTSELQEALASGRQQAGLAPFEVMATDACLMGSIEIADAIAPHVKYWAASEELVPGPGYDYTAIFGPLTQAPTKFDALSFGKLFVSSVKGFYGPGGKEENPSVTQALFDMSKIPDVRNAVDALAKSLQNDVPLHSLSLATASASVDQYGPRTDPTSGSLEGYADLVQVAAVVRETTTHADAKAAASAVIAAVDASRADRYDGDDQVNARGLSIWLPDAEDVEAQLSSYGKVPFGKTSPWRTMLASYSKAFGDVKAPTIKNVVVHKASTNPFDMGPRDVTAQIDGDIREAVMIVSQQVLSNVVPVSVDAVTDPKLFKTLPEGPAITTWKKGSNTVSARWTPQYVTLSGKDGTEFPLVVDHERLGKTTFDAMVTLKSLTQNATEPVLLRFSMATGAFAGSKLLGGFYIDQAEGEQLFTPFDIKELPAGKIAFEPLYTLVDKDGKSNVVKLPLSVRLDDPKDLKINVRPMIPGIYTITILAEDHAGHVSIAKTSTTLP
jgi:hypothetical protein